VNLLRKRRGVSGIISGVFLVAVAVMVFNVLAWQFFQYDAYRRIALERDQREWERLTERIMISDVGYGSYLRFKVFNTGAVTAHIVEIWLNDTTTGTPRHLSLANYITSNCTAWIASGAERWIYTMISLTSGHSYRLKISTERGNIAVALQFYNEPTPTGVQYMPFTFSFGYNDFQYANSTAPYQDNPPPESSDKWSAAWELKKAYGSPWFRIKLRNGADTDVQIETRSHINFVTSTKTSVESKANADSYEVVDIPKEQEKWIVFKKANIGNIPNDSVPATFYVHVAVFYHPSPSGSSRGTTVAILSVYITS